MLDARFKDPVLSELNKHAMEFAASQQYVPAQRKSFRDLIYELHKFCTSSTLVTEEEAIAELQRLLVERTVYRPPFASQVFALPQAAPLVEFVLNNYVRMMRMYQYVYAERPVCDVKLAGPERVIEKPCFDFPSLSEARRSDIAMVSPRRVDTARSSVEEHTTSVREDAVVSVDEVVDEESARNAMRVAVRASVDAELNALRSHLQDEIHRVAQSLR